VKSPLLHTVPILALLCAGSSLVQAQNVNLEPLRSSGYGVVPLERIRPNIITLKANIDGKVERLLVDTAWLEDGVGALDETLGATAAPVTGSNVSARGRGPLAGSVTLGNVRLTNVPIVHGQFPQLRNTVIRRKVAPTGVIGSRFLQTCSALLDLENMRLYLRPPGEGRHVVVRRGLIAAGLAAVPMQQTPQHAELVDAEINGVQGKMLVDTGAYLAAVDVTLAAAIHARPVVTHYGFPRPINADDFTRITRIDRAAFEVKDLVENAPMTQLKSFRLGGVPLRVPDIRLRKIDSPPRVKVIGALGVDILGRNGAIIDFAQQQLYIYPSGASR
jgi:hypothetical protein